MLNSRPIETDECFAAPVIVSMLFVIEGMNFPLLLPDNTVLYSMLKWLTLPLSPEQVRLLWFLGTAGEAQDLEHICEGAAISRLGDEDSAAQEKDQEGHPEAHGGNDVAEPKAEVLLDVGHTSQRQDGSQVDAPVEPVEESARGLGSSVFDLRSHTVQDDSSQSCHRAVSCCNLM